MGEKSSNMVVAGVSFKKTALDIRNKFALTTEQIKKIYTENNPADPDDFFILSTCNRTEVYSTCGNAASIMGLFLEHSAANCEEISRHVFIKSGDEAIKHLFRVASGLDSQILGDYEIIAQLRNAFNLAKDHDKISGLMEKLVNTAIQASRQIKSRTALSDGTTSVSYAVIQRLKKFANPEKNMRICLIGLGKIGKLTLKNLTHYIPQRNITIINRNQLKAETAAESFKVSFARFSSKQEVLQNSDILIVATACDRAIISKAEIASTNIQLIFDLSVPSNVSHEVRTLNNVKLYSVDDLSKVVNKSIDARRLEVPVAEKIINEHFEVFKQWEMRRNLYTIQAVPVSIPLQLMVA